MFFLLYRPIDEGFFDDFPKISDHFRRCPKLLQNLSEGYTKVAEHFFEIFRRLLKISEDLPNISEDFRGRLEDVSIIHQRI